MKITKVMSLILALCLMLTVLGIGVVSASAEEADETPAAVGADASEAEAVDESDSGAWEFSDIAADNCTADEKAILTKALDGIGGANFEPKDVIATQLVSGTNYAFLCKVTPVVVDPVSHWSIVTVYADLEGNAELINTVDIDPADPKTTENAPEEESGAWVSTQKDTPAAVPDAVSDALANNDGVALSPIAVLGTQLVAGTNYRILCYGTTSTATPKTNLYVVDVYVDINGEGEITSVSVFDLKAYVTVPVEEDPTEEATEPTEEKETEKPTEPQSPEKSPATGNSGVVPVMLLLLAAVAGVCVSVKAIAKKND